jgi:hypothetical protein
MFIVAFSFAGLAYRLKYGGKSLPSSGCTMTVASSKEELAQRIDGAFSSLGIKPTRVSQEVWTGVLAPSWRTFGDRIAIVWRDVSERNEVTVLSWTPGLAVVAYGKNRRNIRCVIGAFGGQNVAWMDRETKTREIASVIKLCEGDAV